MLPHKKHSFNYYFGMAPQADYYSPVSIVTVPAFTLGRYVIISPQPENDVQAYLSD